jgi:hypothetical protein
MHDFTLQILRTIYTAGGELKDEEEDEEVMPEGEISMGPAKRPANNQHVQEKTKKQAIASKNDVQPVVTQALGRDSHSRERMVVLVTMPGNIQNLSQLIVEFAEGSKGARLIVWVPRGVMSTDMDRVSSVLGGMEGLDAKDAYLLSCVLEDKMMLKRRNKGAAIMDAFTIVLEKACDANKMPLASVCRSTVDGDIVCCIVLDVPSLNDYGTSSIGRDTMFEV